MAMEKKENISKKKKAVRSGRIHSLSILTIKQYNPEAFMLIWCLSACVLNLKNRKKKKSKYT